MTNVCRLIFQLSLPKEYSYPHYQHRNSISQEKQYSKRTAMFSRNKKSQISCLDKVCYKNIFQPCFEREQTFLLFFVRLRLAGQGH